MFVFGCYCLNLQSTTYFKQLRTSYIQSSIDSTRLLAFKVLDSKCNFCHQSKKRLENFTLDNMDSLIPEIQVQVFVKNRMPKGRRNILSIEEKNALRNWIIKDSGK